MVYSGLGLLSWDTFTVLVKWELSTMICSPAQVDLELRSMQWLQVYLEHFGMKSMGV